MTDRSRDRARRTRRARGDTLDAPAPDDAASAPLTDAELRALVVRARAYGDDSLRRLVGEFVTLRRVTADVIAFIEAREGGAAVANVPHLLRARELVARREARRLKGTSGDRAADPRSEGPPDGAVSSADRSPVPPSRAV